MCTLTIGSRVRKLLITYRYKCEIDDVVGNINVTNIYGYIHIQKKKNVKREKKVTRNMKNIIIKDIKHVGYCSVRVIF